MSEEQKTAAAYAEADHWKQKYEAERTAREAAERDARRYRHLKDNHVRRWTSNMGGPDSLDIGFDANGHDLDAALDAIFRAKAEGRS